MKRNNYKLAILFIDLDHFKEINDTLGHKAGDEVLKITADRLLTSVRESDVVARFGGDEFIILLTNINTIDEVVELTNRVLKKLKEPIILNNNQYYISASIGISVSPNDSIDANTLVQYADIAMYKAKNSGKDCFAFYQSKMTADVNKRIDLKNDIFKALNNHEFELYYQPQFDKSDNIIGVEVLIRWNHPKKGILYPMEFIPLAIEIGLIDKIDLWVIENSIIQYQKWKKEGFDVHTISCNVTLSHMLKDNFIKDLENIIKKYNFDATHLDLELREESIMKYPQKTLKILEKLSKLGIQISIDDFGKGYLSLLYLKKFNISKLKIDRSFIQDIPNDKDDEIITKAIISLAKSLNLEIVAEGVETLQQKEFLLAYTELYVQGFLYSKPLPIDEFEKLFLKGKNGRK
jgi:diguanylate cyclase (GGDEF)-like protein